MQPLRAPAPGAVFVDASAIPTKRDVDSALASAYSSLGLQGLAWPVEVAVGKADARLGDCQGLSRRSMGQGAADMPCLASRRESGVARLRPRTGSGCRVRTGRGPLCPASLAKQAANNVNALRVVVMSKDNLSTEAGLDDAELVRRMQQGDPAAFDALFEKHRRSLLAYACGMLQDRAGAEDVVQDCFVALARQVDTLQAERNVAGWLYRLARNKTVDRLRKMKRERGLAARETERAQAEMDDNPRGQLLRREMAGHVQAALNRLSEKERDLIVLRFFSDLSFAEIASVVRRPLGTVLWQTHNALGKLRRMPELLHE